MKKLLLTGVTALSVLSASAAHAGEGDYFCGKRVRIHDHTLDQNSVLVISRYSRTKRRVVRIDTSGVHPVVTLNGKRCQEGE